MAMCEDMSKNCKQWITYPCKLVFTCLTRESVYVNWCLPAWHEMVAKPQNNISFMQTCYLDSKYGIDI